METARRAAERDELDDWVARFLSSPGSDNAPLAHELSTRLCCWMGPVRLPLNSLHRLAGPPGAPVLCPIDEDDWPERVDDMEQRVDDGWVPPPVIVAYRRGQLVLEDGNHRVESIRRTGRRHVWAVIGFEDREDRDRFTLPIAQ